MPPWASSKRPRRCRSAPVKAPRSWPKSSLSIRLGGRAAQLTTTNGPLRPRALVVDGAGDELLADPCLAEDENRGVAGRHLPHFVEYVQQGVRAADDVLEAVLGADRLPQVDVFLLEPHLVILELSNGALEFTGQPLELRL